MNINVHVDVHIHGGHGDEVPPWLATLTDLIQTNQEVLMATQAEVKAKLDALTADVADEASVIGSVETLLTNLQALIQQLKDAATNAQVDPAIVSQIDALAGAVGANKARIAADVAANTPAANS